MMVLLFAGVFMLWTVRGSPAAPFLAVIGTGSRDGTHVHFLWESREQISLEWDGGDTQVLEANWNSPRVLKLKVQKGRDYSGFLDSQGVRVPWRFTTRMRKLLFLSCNRYAQDGDSTMFAKLAHQSDGDLAVHLGDQVYLDDVVKTLRANDTFEELVGRIRAVYRKTWMNAEFQKFLLSSRHLMVGDDHDLVNNLDFSLAKEPQFQTFIRAALHCYQEYQLALRVDLAEHKVTFPEAIPPSFSFEFLGSGVALALLDTRMEHTFHFDSDHPLLGSRQMDEFVNFVDQVRDSSLVQHLFVASSVPFMFVGKLLSRIIDKVEGEKYPLWFGPHEVGVMLQHLFSLNSTHVYMVGGDLHHASQGSLTYDRGNGPREILSFVTSGITRGSTAARSSHIALMCWFSRLFPPVIEAPLGGKFSSGIDEIFLGRNFLVFDVHREKEPATWRWTWETLEDGPPLWRQWVVTNPVHFLTLSVSMIGLIVWLLLRIAKVLFL